MVKRESKLKYWVRLVAGEFRVLKRQVVKLEKRLEEQDEILQAQHLRLAKLEKRVDRDVTVLYLPGEDRPVHYAADTQAGS